MNLEVLVSTMDQIDYSLLEKMNIQSDAIVINQCNKNEVVNFEYKKHDISFLCFKERGIGLSRNNALMRATGDICLFADDDVTYVDNYREIVIEAFEQNPKADLIFFNVLSRNLKRPSYKIEKSRRVRWFNCLRFGTYQMAVRTERIKQANIYFSLLFGGGAKYGSGEDSLFIVECLKKGLNVYTNSAIIGYVSQSNSSWFRGYTDKFFFDKGVLFAFISKRWARILCLQFILRHREMLSNMSFREAYNAMKKGIKETKG